MESPRCAQLALPMHGNGPVQGSETEPKGCMYVVRKGKEIEGPKEEEQKENWNDDSAGSKES